MRHSYGALSLNLSLFVIISTFNPATLGDLYMSADRTGRALTLLLVGVGVSGHAEITMRLFCCESIQRTRSCLYRKQIEYKPAL